MDEKTESTITTILYTSLIVTLIFIILQNIKSPWIVTALSGLLIISITIRNAMIYTSAKYCYLGKLTVLADIALVFIIDRFDISGSSQVYYYILLADIVIAYSTRFSICIAVLCYLLYAAGKFISLGSPPMSRFYPGVAFHSLVFICIYAVMYIVKYQIKQREKLRQTMFDLKVKSKQLENAYVKLKKTSEDLEEVTILKERNRIAREIHDTVGHTLTTVLLEMEAGERLLNVNADVALEKIRLAKGQVRKGLNDIRESVGILQSGRKILDFVPSLKLLIDETTKHGDIFIKSEISDLPKLTDAQEKTIYRALQEGLTNGIKHGGSTAFVFKLKSENGCIRFFLQDNGAGTDKIVQGFGLTAMEERVKELGGILYMESKAGEGLSISITFPAGKENADESH